MLIGQDGPQGLSETLNGRGAQRESFVVTPVQMAAGIFEQVLKLVFRLDSQGRIWRSVGCAN